MLGLAPLVSLAMWCVRETCAAAEIKARRMQAAPAQTVPQLDPFAQTRQTPHLFHGHPPPAEAKAFVAVTSSDRGSPEFMFYTSMDAAVDWANSLRPAACGWTCGVPTEIVRDKAP